MKGPLILILFLITFFAAHAQAKVDSVQQNLAPTFQIDLDSVQGRLITSPDSLLPVYHKIDSIRNDFNFAADSLKGEYNTMLSKIDAQRNRLDKTIDSPKVKQYEIQGEHYHEKVGTYYRWLH